MLHSQFENQNQDQAKRYLFLLYTLVNVWDKPSQHASSYPPMFNSPFSPILFSTPNIIKYNHPPPPLVWSIIGPLPPTTPIPYFLLTAVIQRHTRDSKVVRTVLPGNISRAQIPQLGALVAGRAH